MRWWLDLVRSRTAAVLGLGVVLAVGVIAHELIHAAAALALGGEIIELSVLPSFAAGRLELGHVIFINASSPRWVAAAPTVAWLLLAALAALASGRLRSPKRATALVVVLVALPMIDLSLGFAGFFLGEPGADLSIALGGWRAIACAGFAFVAVGSALLIYDRLRASESAPPTALAFGLGYAGLLLAPWAIYL